MGRAGCAEGAPSTLDGHCWGRMWPWGWGGDLQPTLWQPWPEAWGEVGSSSMRVLGAVHGAWAATVPPWGTGGGELPALPRVAAGGCPLGQAPVDLRLSLPALWSPGAKLAVGIAVGSPPVGAHGHQALPGARGSVGTARSRLSHLLTAPSPSRTGGDLSAPPGDTQGPREPVPCSCSFCA